MDTCARLAVLLHKGLCLILSMYRAQSDCKCNGFLILNGCKKTLGL